MGGALPNRAWALAVFSGILLCSTLCLSPARAGSLERVSVGCGSAEPNGVSESPVVSADGRFVAFASAASNLVPDDMNGCADVFVYDRVAHTMERVSVASDGTEGDGASDSPSISGDGQLVVFASQANNLIPGGTGGKYDIYLRDRSASTTGLVTGTVSGGTSWAPRISADGRFVAFMTSDGALLPGVPEAKMLREVSVKDLMTGTYECPSFPFGSSDFGLFTQTGPPALSADGRYALFTSTRRGLVPLEEDRLFGRHGIYVRDRLTGVAMLGMPRGAGELPPLSKCEDLYLRPAISADGRFVAFFSSDDGLVPEDSNWVPDVFLYDLVDKTTERVSIGFDGSDPLNCSREPSVSADGRYVAFVSCATNLVADCPPVAASQVFVRDRSAGTTELATLGADGAAGEACSSQPSISADGRVVAFLSSAGNLVSGGDANGLPDVYVYCVAPPGNTEPGTNVPVSPGEGIAMTFGEVTGAGDTTVAVSDTHAGGPPSGFRFLGTYYDISTTAGYSGTITISFPYDPATMTDKKEGRLTVFHYDPVAAQWENVTVSVDTVNHLVIASVTSLSWFGIAYPAYDFKGFLPPIADGAGKPFKRGSTIPVKFRIADAAGNPVTDATARLTVYYVGDGAPPGEPEVVSTAAGDFGDLFRYSATDDLYIFNLSTKHPSFLDYYTYSISVTLDGDPGQSVEFSLK